MEDKKDGSGISSICAVCGEKFSNSQESLKHELIVHSLEKKSSLKNHVQKRLNATAKFLNTDEKKQERERLKIQLNDCKSGEELQKIFELFCMKNDNLGLIFTRIQTCLEKELQKAGVARIYPFGSIASGLALRDCDIDIYLDASEFKTSPDNKNSNRFKAAFNCITKLLHRSTHFSEVYAIRNARVPIIKCQHNDTGFSIDINISHPSSRENTQFIHDLVKSDERIHELMLFLKLWAKNNQIVGKDNMTSYCLITMVIFFLQQPRLATGSEATTDNKDTRILKSINELQENCAFHMVQGVNYAYDLTSVENKPQLPKSISTWDLIKEFFDFYEKLNFKDHVVSPFYGKLIASANLIPKLCDEYYKQIRTITQYMKGEPANELQIDRCVCVQDAFCLNQNTAKNILPHKNDYILVCLQNATKICENPKNLTLAQLYEQLLFDTIKTDATETKQSSKTELIKNMPKLKLTPVNSSSSEANLSETNISYKVIPSKADLRLISANFPKLITGKEILQCWCKHYIEAISIILTKVYRIDIHEQVPTQQKQQKLDKEENYTDLNRLWEISCTIDLWSNRCFQKKSQTSFISYQLLQTECLHILRRQDPKFSVTLNGYITIITLPNNNGIEVKIELPNDAAVKSFSKRTPLRKFFNVLKNTLQSCSCKEILNIEKAKVETSEEASTTADTD